MTRFPAQLPYSKWPKVSTVFGLMINGDWAGVQAYFEDPANRPDITDSIGAGNFWWAQFTPPKPVILHPPLVPGASPRPQQYDPDTVYSVRLDGDAPGGCSFSVSSGGVQVVGSVSDVEGDFNATTQTGSGAIPRIPGKAGQWFNMRLGDGMPAQSGRFDAT